MLVGRNVPIIPPILLTSTVAVVRIRKNVSLHSIVHDRLGSNIKRSFMRKKGALFTFVAVLAASYSFSQSSTADYLGQPLPGDTPEVFAPNILSKAGRMERVLAFAVDKKEVYFTVILSENCYTIKSIAQKDGVWQAEQTASFVDRYMKEYSCLEPFISPDGATMLFVAKQQSVAGWGYALYVTKRTDDGWGKPELLSSHISSPNGVWHPCVTSNGNLYFAIDGNIYFSAHSSSGFADPVAIGTINSPSQDWDPYVDPSESYLIFKSNRPGGFGKSDNYISYKSPSGEWTKPQNIGVKYNTDQVDDAGDISPDGALMFFSRVNQDGEMDVYWVKASFIKELNPFLNGNMAKE